MLAKSAVTLRQKARRGPQAQDEGACDQDEGSSEGPENRPMNLGIDEHMWDGFEKIPVGIRAFMETEKAIKARHTGRAP